MSRWESDAALHASQRKEPGPERGGLDAALPEFQRRQRRQPRQHPRHSRPHVPPKKVETATGAGGREQTGLEWLRTPQSCCAYQGCGMPQSGCEVLQPEGCAKAANAKWEVVIACRVTPVKFWCAFRLKHCFLRTLQTPLRVGLLFILWCESRRVGTRV